MQGAEGGHFRIALDWRSWLASIDADGHLYREMRARMNIEPRYRVPRRWTGRFQAGPIRPQSTFVGANVWREVWGLSNSVGEFVVSTEVVRGESSMDAASRLVRLV